MSARMLADGRLLTVRLLTGEVISSPGFNVRLFKADITPTENDLSSPYIAGEADFSGYSPVTVGSWSPASDSFAFAASLAYPATFQVAFVPSVGNTVYGYFVTASGADSDVLLAERFNDGPYDMILSGETIVVLVELTARSQFT